MPQKPTGSNNEANFAQKVHEAVFGFRNKILTNSFFRVSYTASGISIVPKFKLTGAGGNVRRFTFKTMLGDYFLTNEGVAVAKPYNIQNNIDGETVYGTALTYTYPHNPDPSSQDGGPSTDYLAYVYRLSSNGEVCLVTPAYEPGDYIDAYQPAGGTGITSQPLDTVTSGMSGVPVPIAWQQVGGAYAWALASDQTFGKTS